MIDVVAATLRALGANVLIAQGTGCGGEDRGFIGERHEADTGLIDLNARWYDPATGFFLTPDWLDPVDDDTGRGLSKVKKSLKTIN